INVEAGRIARLPITFIRNSSVSINALKSRCRTLKKRGKLDILIIDYLQLMSGEKTNNREQEISKISRELKKMAMELNIPIVVLSQLSREVEKREQKKPQLSDLRESGAIEQDADIVILLNRPIYYGIKEIEDDNGNKLSSVGIGVAYVAKNRNGSIGNVLFRHNETMTKLTDYEQFG
ncbi:MAG: DnaB-like helicase C-terminal domain-containing protein, partial [Alistipes sp.]